MVWFNKSGSCGKIAKSVKRNPGNSVAQMHEWFFRLYCKSWKMENVNSASTLLIYSHFTWDCRDSFKSSHAPQHILYEADAVFYSLLAVFWFSTSSSIASLRFSGGGGAFAFVILNSSLSTIFHCRCSEPSIVIGIVAFQSLCDVNAPGVAVLLIIINDLESQAMMSGEMYDQCRNCSWNFKRIKIARVNRCTVGFK